MFPEKVEVFLLRRRDCRWLGTGDCVEGEGRRELSPMLLPSGQQHDEEHWFNTTLAECP